MEPYRSLPRQARRSAVCCHTARSHHHVHPAKHHPTLPAEPTAPSSAPLPCHVINQRRWRGDETVLDVDGGRGLVAIEAARRVPHGQVYGVDIWQTQDPSGNSSAAILNNAAIADVGSRLAVETRDARSLPYPHAAFDVVTSMTAIHNLPSATDTLKAVSELWRVSDPAVRSFSSGTISAAPFRSRPICSSAIANVGVVIIVIEPKEAALPPLCLVSR